jgi:hypothetical protein
MMSTKFRAKGGTCTGSDLRTAPDPLGADRTCTGLGSQNPYSALTPCGPLSSPWVILIIPGAIRGLTHLYLMARGAEGLSGRLSALSLSPWLDRIPGERVFLVGQRGARLQKGDLRPLLGSTMTYRSRLPTRAPVFRIDLLRCHGHPIAAAHIHP